ncbi:MAG: hypothetical protein HGA47_12145 [Zoogloea sp.]|nr:hypothetical protein [Zoogloea sp.]
MLPPRCRHLAIAAALVLALPAAFACRPFGSYEFVEDAQGGIWFTEGDNNAVSRLAPDGAVKSFPLPTPNAEPSSVALDRRGNLWFVEMEGGKIGRLSPDGRITEFPVSDGHAFQLAVDRAGNAWYAQMGHENAGADDVYAGYAQAVGIGRVNEQGVRHFYPLEAGWPTSVAVDARQRIWASVLVPGRHPRGRIDRLEADGRWRTMAAWNDSCPRNLVPTPDGGLYFSDGCATRLGRVEPGGRILRRALPAGTSIQQMSLARDGGLWITDREHLARIDRRGRVRYVQRPDNGDQTMAVLATRGGDVVFSEFYNYNINRLKKSGELVEHLVSVDQRHGAREVKDGETCQIRFAARIAEKAVMDRRRADEVAAGRFKPVADGTEQLAAEKCLACHDTRRLLLSRRSDWSPSISRMQAYMVARNVPVLTVDERERLVRYFNGQYGLEQ